MPFTMVETININSGLEQVRILEESRDDDRSTILFTALRCLTIQDFSDSSCVRSSEEHKEMWDVLNGILSLRKELGFPIETLVLSTLELPDRRSMTPDTISAEYADFCRVDADGLERAAGFVVRVEDHRRI